MKHLLKTNQNEKRTMAWLFSKMNYFKDELFRIGLANEKDNKEDSYKMKPEEVDSGFRGNISEQTEKRHDAEKMNVNDGIEKPKDDELNANVSGEKAEPKQSEDTMSTLNTARPTCVSCPTADFGDQKPTESKLEEPSQNNNHNKSEIHLKQDNVTHDIDQEHEDMKIKDLKTNQTEKKMINPLTLLKEDLLKVFKDTKFQLEDQTSNLMEIKPTTLSLLKDSLNEFKDVISSKHKDMKSAEPKMSCTREKSDNQLNLHTEDLVFRNSLSNEKNSNEDPLVLKTERTDEPFRNLFRRDQKFFRISAKTEDSDQVKNRLSEMKEEQLDRGCRGILLEKEEEQEKHNAGKNTKDRIDQPGDSEPEEKSDTSFSEAQQSGEMTSALNSRAPRGFLKNLFRRDQKLLTDTQEVKNKPSVKKEEQLDIDFRGSLTEQKEDNNREGSMNNTEMAMNVPEEKSEYGSFSETQQSQDMSTLNMTRSTGFGDQKPTPEETKSKSNLQEDNLTNASDQEDLKEEHVKAQDLLKTNQREKRTISPLTLLKEDFNHFKDDLLNVFRIGLTKEKDKEEKNEEKLDAEKMDNYVKEWTDQSEDSDLDINVSEESSETSFFEDTMWILRKGEDEKKNEQEGDRISLFALRDANKDGVRVQQEDPWSLMNFAICLTFDPNTANSELLLTKDNRKATRVWPNLQSLDHPDRFQRCPQVLCREGLLDCVYWEVKWSGGADIGVAYNSISRDGGASSCLLGHNKHSWSLECTEGSYTPCHNNRRFRSSSPEPFTRTVGVYLDWSAGSLSFYCVSPDTTVHLHTFSSTFTEPLYAGFWIWAYEGSVSLYQ